MGDEDPHAEHRKSQAQISSPLENRGSQIATSLEEPMFNGRFGLGRAYRKLPSHHDFNELANNVEQIASYLMNRSLGSFASEGYLKAPERWEWQLGNDLKLLIEYARGFVPPDTDGLHHFSGRGKRGPGAGGNA